MPKALLIQLPVPQLNFGRISGNIPFAAACLKQAATPSDLSIEIFSEHLASYVGDEALLDLILRERPDIIGFSTYLWNVTRILYFASQIKNHYSPQIILGGPEVTPDNLLIQSSHVDECCFGAGETFFANLMKGRKNHGQRDANRYFTESPSPYVTGQIHLGRDHPPMLLETMRGCPHRCAYCYYHKSQKVPIFKPQQAIEDGLLWAMNEGAQEVYILDPSLDARPDLHALLKKIAGLNTPSKVALVSEIRAEMIDERLADELAAAGFIAFEIGLQSTNPKAWDPMKRPTDLLRFLQGIYHLKRVGIKTSIDLIAGLPGDDLINFKKSIDFIQSHGLQDHLQVFPLLILPGTQFRQNAHRLGLSYDSHPPYTVLSTPEFSSQDMVEAMDYVENRLDIALYPQPDLDLAYLLDDESLDTAKDLWVQIGAHRFIRKVVLHPERSNDELSRTAQRVTLPYQLLIPPRTTAHSQIDYKLHLFTERNPFTPLELVFFEPGTLPDCRTLLSSAALMRPHYLDGDKRWMFDEAGNRAILFSLVTCKENAVFFGMMQRRIFWWKGSRLPELSDLDHLGRLQFNGILVDLRRDSAKNIPEWQQTMALHDSDTIAISFAQVSDQARWFKMIAPNAHSSLFY